MSPIDAIQGQLKDLETKINDFKAKQQLPVRFGLEGVQGALNGVGIGIVSFWFNKQIGGVQNSNPNATPEMKAQMEKMAAMQPKTVLASVRNFVVLFGVQASLTAAFKHYRQGKDDDIWNQMGPALGAGVAYALASGAPDQAIAMGAGFAAFSGLFYQIGEWTGKKQGGPAPDDQFRTSHHILSSLKLEKFHKNLRNGQLSDDTIMLWNDAALQECRIPPGPRLLILHHLDQVRKANKSLPTFPTEVPSSYVVGKQ